MQVGLQAHSSWHGDGRAIFFVRQRHDDSCLFPESTFVKGKDGMNSALTPDEQSYLNGFLSGQFRGFRSLRMTANLLLLAGGLLLAGTALYISQNMTDLAVYTVGLPNFIGGILLLVCAMVLFKKAAHVKMLHSILSKLSRTTAAA